MRRVHFRFGRVCRGQASLVCHPIFGRSEYLKLFGGREPNGSTSSQPPSASKFGTVLGKAGSCTAHC